MKLTINKSKCPQDHKCPAMAICSKDAISQEDTYSLPKIDDEKCIVCGKCVKFCPKGAFEKAMHRLDNPKRVAELNPHETLAKIGLLSDSVFCDVGAGTGVFTYAAAEITKGKIYAIDISGEMLKILHSKNKSDQVIINNSVKNVPLNSCDTVLLCTVLHELEDAPDILEEIKRILKANGILAIIEFHKRPTPMGAPMKLRLSEDETIGILADNGFVRKNGFVLGENLYCLLFERGNK